jgi:stearoyl-CoA desaturase (Delta-9 desaturase)
MTSLSPAPAADTARSESLPVGDSDPLELASTPADLASPPPELASTPADLASPPPELASAPPAISPASTPDFAPDAVRPVSNPLVDRLASGVVTAAPPIMLVVGMWFGWTGHILVWQDVLILALCYVAVGTGVTVGFHRLLTHRSFKCHRWLRFAFAALGSAAAEGPVIDWVATHRKHHQFSDVDGDPHSPHVGHGTGWRGALTGLAHAHIGWVFTDMEVADERRYAKDLLADPLIRFVDRTFVLWVVVGLAAAFGLGVALTGTITGGLAALLWGGAARIFLVHHATFSINSLCHFFGRRAWDTKDESRNLAWLAIPTWGEAWHNNHHAFPTSYRHGLRRWQIDPSAGVIRLLEMMGLAWDVVRVDPARLARTAPAHP